ncbi:pre-mRNA-splicing factor 18-like isoform X4 [Schistocerca gregaria]|uniref:pre-mRNA-splicing factor 18-like isoform X4 n=1 Tax=Schistocerca gregaria TaxID=7010 RepID=UPI00211F2C8D|nr:pre-mRNA-splicing factor 18-like isoform X4 [Schistocerca gregaria]XP_049849772.1 pre-mRNA-splicing factor 18-like isoform X4 [Schistocerca gregaria]
MSLSFLKDQINQKKRCLGGSDTSRKWVKRGEIEQDRQRKYLEEEREREEARRRKLEAKLSAQESSGKYGLKDEEEQPLKQIRAVLPLEEVLCRLRARGEPITYFGESDLQRAERLRKLEHMKPMEYNETNEKEWTRIIREEEEVEGETEAAKKKIQQEDAIFLIEDREPKNPQEEVLFWCRESFAEWKHRLDDRDDVTKKSAQGKVESARFKQTQNYIRPFLLQLSGRKGVEPVQDDIFVHVFEIYKACKVYDYRQANDAYYRLAIGNAPWPMGVTMVGIHERSAREKISTSSVAHVLNDETQRKYISAIKRMVTFLQSAYPTLPSRSVM